MVCISRPTCPTPFTSDTHHVCVLGHFCHVQLCATLWTVASQAPLSIRFSKQGYWSGLPCPSPGDLPNLVIEPLSFLSPVLAGGFSTTSTTQEVTLRKP